MTATPGREQAPSAAVDPRERILELLQRQISLRTESQAPHCRQANDAYLRDIASQLQPLGFTTETCANPASGDHPLLIATRRESAASPTVLLYGHGDVQFRGSLNIRLTCTERGGAHHSGNWGGKLRNPATVLAAAIAALVDGNGRILIDALRPPALPEAVREAIAALPAGAASPGDPAVDTDWGEPGLSLTERALGFNTLEVLTLDAGTPAAPVNAIPGEASALLQLRFVLGTDPEAVVPAIRTALTRAGIRNVEVRAEEGMAATRLSPDHPAVTAAACAITSATGREPAVLPNLGGTIPNAVFSQTLNLPTVWIPHSYPACNQHAPDEHLLLPILAEGYEIMRTIFLGMGEHPGHWFAAPAVPSRTTQEA